MRLKYWGSRTAAAFSDNAHCGASTTAMETGCLCIFIKDKGYEILTHQQQSEPKN
ncbi:uncharacterized protein FFFS_15887 [Fusarium fujikuroi]|nr:uncharacterized protein FFFS_15887 [Fusarium fujikuroi]